MLESMASGVPAIVTHTGGLKYLVQSGENGHLRATPGSLHAGSGNGHALRNVWRKCGSRRVNPPSDSPRMQFGKTSTAAMKSASLTPPATARRAIRWNFRTYSPAGPRLNRYARADGHVTADVSLVVRDLVFQYQ